MGRPEHKPTAETKQQAETLSGLGLPHDQIAAIIGISDETLRKHYGTELRLGKARACATIADTLYNRARGGDTTAMIWWTKAQMRWAETARVESSGPDGGPQHIRYSWGEPVD
jgi:hypothetical protein